MRKKDKLFYLQGKTMPKRSKHKKQRKSVALLIETAEIAKSIMQIHLIVMLVVIANPVRAQSGKSHPWIAEAPGEFVRLIDRGNVKIVADDERVKQAGKRALTLFQFIVDYDIRFRHQSIGFDNETGSWREKVISWMDQPKVRPEHTVCFLTTFTPASPWESKLLRHEFDHVAISTDPRLLKIIKRTLQQRREWVVSFQQVLKPTELDIRKSIQEKVAAEIKSLEQLVQTQYDYLDKESHQGSSAIGQRDLFFKGLYTIEGLERCKFEFDTSMKSYVTDKLSNSSSEKEVLEHYLFLAP